MRNVVRRVHSWLVSVGLANEYIIADCGTWKCRFLVWLYGEPEMSPVLRIVQR